MSPPPALDAMAGLEEGDIEGLAAGAILEQARSLQGWPVDVITADPDRASK